MSKVGVVVGRFQVPALTTGHKALLKGVLDKNDAILVLIGTTMVRGDTHDPLPPECVAENLHNFLTNLGKPFILTTIEDHPSDETWCKNLDELIIENLLADDVPTLYGSRDSFLKCYKGQFPHEELPSADNSSGTAERSRWQKKTEQAYELLDKKPKMSLVEAFNAGVVHTASLLYPTSFQCVDIIAHTPRNEVVLIKKTGCKEYQLPGGFVDVKDGTLEEAALRELDEETNLKGNLATYFTSLRINDYRYRNRRDKVMTTLFEVKVTDADLKYMRPQDDAASVHTLHISEILKFGPGDILPGHMELLSTWADKTKIQ